MNIGQVFEVHLGWVGKGIGQRIGDMLQREAAVAEIRAFMEQVYNSTGRKEAINKLSDAEVRAMARELSSGVPFASPVFDGATEQEILDMLKLAYPDEVARAQGLTPSRTQA